MATLDPRKLRRRQSIQVSGVGQMQFFDFATEATEAEVLADGFFNGARDQLTVGSIIEAIVDCTDTLTYTRIQVATVPATGDVTVTSSKPTFS